MSELGPDARSLIDAAAEGDNPSVDDATRVRTKLAARLSLAAAAGVAATVGTKATAGAAITGSAMGGSAASASASATAAKILLAVALVGGTVATGAVVFRPDSRIVEPRPQPTSLSAPAVAAPRNGALPFPPPELQEPPELPDLPHLPEHAVTAPAPPVPQPSSARSAPPAPQPSSARSAPRVPQPSSARSAPPSPRVVIPSISPSDSVVEEASLLRAARAALAQGDGTLALTHLDEHAARFPDGALSEERQAARVFALCSSGRVAEARAIASAFMASSPRSPLAAQVRRSCATHAE